MLFNDLHYFGSEDRLRPPDSLSLPEKVSGGLSHSLDRARLFRFFDKGALAQIESTFLGKAATGRYARPH